MTTFSQYFQNYRFNLESTDGRVMACRAVLSDPFSPDTLWIVREHHLGHQMLEQWFVELGEERRFRVRMHAFLKDQSHDRVLDVTFESREWLPFDLDADEIGVATEAVKLLGVRYHLASPDGAGPTTT